jgi:16S rRNA (adenine1518-N6/adenine1519-N6)-dimethyltransferase
VDKKNIEISPKKSLGQNFLLDENILQEIAELAEVSDNDVILEIGPGTGLLTKELATRARKVIAIEKDERLISVLQKNLENFDNVKIISDDIKNIISSINSLELEKGNYKLVANLPYYLSSFIIRRFLEIDEKPEKITITLQKELAERICEKPGNMSLISVMVNFYGEPRLGPVITRDKFYPSPQVDSQIVVIDKINSPNDIDIKFFFRTLRIGFSSKRKMLWKNLRNGFRLSKEQIFKIFGEININTMSRAQELSLEQWKKLSTKIKLLEISN